MPDKDNENKFMAMLERMGMVRKLDSEDEPEREYSEPASRKSQSLIPDEDEPSRSTEIHSEDAPAGSYKTAHQPVPGMPDPIVPEEKPQTAKPEKMWDEPQQEPQPHKAQPRPVQPRPVPPLAEDFDDSDLFSGMFDEPEPYRQAQRTPADTSYRADIPFREEEPIPGRELPIEAYTDRCLDVDELYEVFSMKTSGTDTIYLIEDYLESLPASLPDDSRREIIIKILAASGFSYDSLMNDGVGRVGKLKEYAEQFAQRTEDYISSRSAELESLERQIQKVRSLIDRRRELHKKQFFTIEAEAQRLKDLLAFLSE